MVDGSPGYRFFICYDVTVSDFDFANLDVSFTKNNDYACPPDENNFLSFTTWVTLTATKLSSIALSHLAEPTPLFLFIIFECCV